MENQSKLGSGELLCILGAVKRLDPNARLIQPNYIIDHDKKEIVLNPDYDALHDAGLPELKAMLLLSFAAFATFIIWLVDFA